MEDIPIFSGEKTELDSWLTCGRFLSIIEDHVNMNNLTEEQMKGLCFSKLSNGALELFQNHSDQSWYEIKNLLFEKFPVNMSIRDKVEVRKKLQQQESESIDDFYIRCIQAQYLVSDDMKDVGFEREVLLHFLIGLSPLIRDLVLATKCCSTTEYIKEAKKYTKMYKEEPPEVNVKIEVDPFYEEYDAKNPLEEFSQYDSYGNNIYQENQEEIIKPLIFENIDQKKFECSLCGKVTSTNGKLKLHMQTIHKKCAKCGKTFVDKEKHYQKFHSELKCKFCEFICKDNATLKVHLKEKHNKNMGWSNCRICNEVLKSKKSRMEHEEQEHSHLKQTCEICNEVCLSIHFLTKHIVNKHCTNNPEGKIMCYYCNKDYSGSGLLVYHILNRHFNQPLHPCSVCGKGFDTKSTLKIHMQARHNVERNYQCDKCPKTFKTLTSLNIHSKNMHKESENLECKDCGKLFRNKMFLRNHQLSKHSENTTKTKIVCDDCGKSFAQKQSFLDHSLTHLTEEEKEQKKLSCQFSGCDYSTLRKPLLETHIKRVHERKKNFQCSLCPKSFFSKGHFEEHTNGVHLNLKPFQCEKCEFATAYRTILREHNKVAHGNQRFDCPYCNHSARYKGNLDKHINNVHKNLQTIMTEKIHM